MVETAGSPTSAIAAGAPTVVGDVDEQADGRLVVMDGQGDSREGAEPSRQPSHEIVRFWGHRRPPKRPPIEGRFLCRADAKPERSVASVVDDERGPFRFADPRAFVAHR